MTKRLVRLTSGLAVLLYGAAVWAQAPAGVLRFKIDPAASTVTATVAEPMAAVRGSATGAFTVLRGAVQGSAAAIAGTARVEVVIDASSYKSDSAARDRVVKASALEAVKFPTIRFVSDGCSQVQRDGEQAAALRVLGKLTLHGVTKEIVLPVHARLDARGRLITEGQCAFKLAEFGIKRPSALLGLLVTGDTATVAFHVVADPQ